MLLKRTMKENPTKIASIISNVNNEDSLSQYLRYATKSLRAEFVKIDLKEQHRWAQLVKRPHI